MLLLSLGGDRLDENLVSLSENGSPSAPVTSSMAVKRLPSKPMKSGASRDGDMTATNKEMGHDVSTSARLKQARVLLVPWIPVGTKVLLRNEATRRFSQNAFFVPPSIGRHARIDGDSNVPQSAISFVPPTKGRHARIEEPGGPQYAI